MIWEAAVLTGSPGAGEAVGPAPIARASRSARRRRPTTRRDPTPGRSDDRSRAGRVPLSGRAPAWSGSRARNARRPSRNRPAAPPARAPTGYAPEGIVEMRRARLALLYLCCSRWSRLFASRSSIDPCTELHKMHIGGQGVGGATVTGRMLSRGHTARSQLPQLSGLAHVHHASLQAHEAGPRQPPQLLVGGLTAQICEGGDQLLTHVQARARR